MYVCMYVYIYVCVADCWLATYHSLKLLQYHGFCCIVVKVTTPVEAVSKTQGLSSVTRKKLCGISSSLSSLSVPVLPPLDSIYIPTTLPL